MTKSIGIEQLIAAKAKTGGACMLCGKHTHNVNVFEPQKGDLLDNTHATKIRLYVLNLCFPCAKKGTTTFEQVEAQVQKQMVTGDYTDCNGFVDETT